MRKTLDILRKELQKWNTDDTRPEQEFESWAGVGQEREG